MISGLGIYDMICYEIVYSSLVNTVLLIIRSVLISSHAIYTGRNAVFEKEYLLVLEVLINISTE